MKRIITSALVLSGMLTYAQEGKVGVNTLAPKATLDIRPLNATGTTNEGILVPKLSKDRVANIDDANLVEGTMVYATDAVYTGTNPKVSKIDAKGYYYYDGTEWVKVGAGASATGGVAFLGPATGNIRTVTDLPSSEWKNDDFTILLTMVGSNVALPKPSDNKNRIIALRNLTSTSRSFNGDWTPVNNSAIGPYRGMLLQSDGTSWYVIAGF